MQISKDEYESLPKCTRTEGWWCVRCGEDLNEHRMRSEDEVFCDDRAESEDWITLESDPIIRGLVRRVFRTERLDRAEGKIITGGTSGATLTLHLFPDPTRFIPLPIRRVEVSEVQWFRTDKVTGDTTKEVRRPFKFEDTIQGEWSDDAIHHVQEHLWNLMKEKMEGVPHDLIQSIILEHFIVEQRFNEETLTLKTECHLSLRWLAQSATEIYGEPI